MAKYRRITYQDRLKIEALYNAGVPVDQISETLGFRISGLYYELNKGYYNHRNTDLTYSKKYSADRAQQITDFNTAGRVKSLKVGKDYKFIEFVEDLIINKHYSPRAVLAEIKRRKLHFDCKVSYNTIYRYIDQGIFPNLKRTDLPYKPRKLKKKKIVVKKESKLGKSIELRPAEAATRDAFGHWELDSVIGKREKGNTLLVLTERKTRYELIFRAKDKSAFSTLKVINALEKKLGRNFKKVFKTITCDNGCEFNASDALERSLLTRRNRTSVYYCHPYASSERGSNEKQNQMIRRWVRKSEKIENYSDEYLGNVVNWLNEYPRGIFDYETSKDRFSAELRKINVKNF